MTIICRCGVAIASILCGSAAAIAQTKSPLEVRVSIDHKNARAADVLQSLASAAGLKLDVIDQSMQPVTVTLTNARVRTALDAVCENAGCRWSLVTGQPAVLKVERSPGGAGLQLNSEISFQVKGARIDEALRMLASSLDVALVVEGTLPVFSINAQMQGVETSAFLDALCRVAKCSWRVEPAARRLVVSAK